MQIGNLWVKNARLRILNGLVAVPGTPAWIAFPQTLFLDNEEHAIIVGLQQLFTASAGGVINLQILFNGTTAHDGYIRSCTDATSSLLIGNQQPTCMPFPPIDVPPDTEIGMRAQFMPGVGVNLYMDLYLVSYYMADQEVAMKPVCFPGAGDPDICP